MLLGNSIMLGLAEGLVVRAAGVEWPEVVATIVLGLLLCAAWWVMTTSAWKVFRTWIDEGLRFSWQNFQMSGTLVNMAEMNPLEVSRRYRDAGFASVYNAARAVIVVFILGYVFMLIDYFLLRS